MRVWRGRELGHRWESRGWCWHPGHGWRRCLVCFRPHEWRCDKNVGQEAQRQYANQDQLGEICISIVRVLRVVRLVLLPVDQLVSPAVNPLWLVMDVAQRYCQYLSDTDLSLLANASDLGVAERDGPAHLRANPSLIEGALASPGAFSATFDPGVSSDPLIMTSPFLLFAVAVHRGIAELAETSFIEERIGARQRVPVFGTEDLAAFTDTVERRLFLIEHLASYTRVKSGPVYVERGGRRRRQRFSEIDPQRLAAMLDVVPEAERSTIYRRLGDLALFMTGVFPDSTTRRTPHPIEIERLLRTVRGQAEIGRLGVDDIDDIVGGRGSAGLLEWLGPRWYRLSAEAMPIPSISRLLREVADGFDGARRFLTLVADRYILPQRERWFPLGAMPPT